MVALANPRTESALITLAGALATHQGGRVLATHIVTVPDQTSLDVAAQNRDRIDASSEDLLDAAKADAEALGVAVDTKTILSHRALEAVYDAARTNDADTVVMGYGGAQFAGGRAEGALDELAHDLPCDFLVFDGQEFEPTDVLVPTAGGASSDLSAEVAIALQDVVDADIALLHVADEGAETAGREFLEGWTETHGLSEAEILIETGDVEAAIERLAPDYSLVVIGATEQGLLSRIVRSSLTFDVLRDVETPVLLAERPSDRSLVERLFGRR